MTLASVAALGRRSGNLLGFAACVLLLGFAYLSQYALGLEPCPLCILQRVAVLVLGLVFLAAALHATGRRRAAFYGLLLAVLGLLGAAIAGRHVWITTQPPGTVADCGASLDYMLEVLPLAEVMSKVFTGSGECGAIDWRFLGLSMPAWVLVWLLALGTWGLWVNLRRS